MKTMLLYGLEAGQTERYTETLLCGNARTLADVEKVQAIAARNGFHSFRVSVHVEGERPNFIGAVK